MPTRMFTPAELTGLDLPPASAQDIEYRDDLHLDEHVRVLKYTQLRRMVFTADDGLTYAVVVVLDEIHPAGTARAGEVGHA